MFRDGETDIPGHCLNLSESGLLATFAQPLELWVVGVVTLRAPGLEGTLRVRVARSEGSQAGLAFQFASESERAFVRQVLAFAARETHLVGAPPF